MNTGVAETVVLKNYILLGIATKVIFSHFLLNEICTSNSLVGTRGARGAFLIICNHLTF